MLPSFLQSLFADGSPQVASLRTLADRLLRSERRSHTLQATALLHEACMRLARLPDRQYAPAVLHDLFARAMRRTLVDHARARRVRHRAATASAMANVPSRVALAEPLALALEELAATSPRQAKVVELRFFVGLRAPEIARCLGITERTVARDWAFAQASLRDLLADDRS